MTGQTDNVSDHPARIALFPGAFDPVTHGHLDIIGRAAGLFERLVVAVGRNPLKEHVFTPEERQAMLVAHTRRWPNVEVPIYRDLTVDFARRIGADVIIRGIRDGADLRAELEIANTNLIISGIETIFLMTSHQHVLTSSTLIKQIVEMGGADIQQLSKLVPADVAKRLEDKLRPSAGA
ncbi:MAG: pantetheine-phosphate adenylyltransferase [Phycisphaerae bacterium]